MNEIHKYILLCHILMLIALVSWQFYSGSRVRSFSAVARACDMTPSAVSKLISRLEKDLALGCLTVQHVSFNSPVKDVNFMSKSHTQ